MHAHLRETRNHRTSCVRPNMMLSLIGRLMAMFQRVPPSSVTVQFMPLETGVHLLLGHHAEVHVRVHVFLRESIT